MGLLRGTGSTLTSYVFGNSPAGEGAAPQKAYAAAVVLLLFVLGLNLLVERHRAPPGAGDRPVGRDRGGLGRCLSTMQRWALYNFAIDSLTSVFR